MWSVHTFKTSAHSVSRVHPTTRARPGTRILLDILHDLIRSELALLRRLKRLVHICSEALVCGADVDGFLESLRIAGLNGTAVDHETGAVMPRETWMRRTNVS